MHITKHDILSMEKIYRLNLINSVTGIKPANLIGTRSSDQNSNLAIFSSVVHLGSNPPLLGFVMRPQGEVKRHTYENIQETGYYTINHIHDSFVERAHYTSAKFDKEVSEFKECGMTEEYVGNFYAPFVKESQLKLGMSHLENIPIKSNGTMLIVGTIEHLILEREALSTEGYVDLDRLDSVGISGLNSYYRFKKIFDLPYARVSEVPDFN